MKNRSVEFFKRYLSSEALAPKMGFILPMTLLVVGLIAWWRI